MKNCNISACPLEEIDPILRTWAASCPHWGGGRSSAADVDVPAFEERGSKREAKTRERAGARGQDQG